MAGLVVFGAIGALVLMLVAFARKQSIDLLFAAATKLGATDVVVRWNHLSGRLGPLPFRWTLTPGGQNRTAATTIEVECATTAMILALRLQTKSEAAAVARGEAIDIDVDDPAFDAMWVVEGAPTERVRRVFTDARLRDRLKALGAERNADVLVDGHKVTIHVPGQYASAGQLDTSGAVAAAALAEAVLAESEKQPETTATDDQPIDYRAAPRPAGVDDGMRKLAAAHALRDRHLRRGLFRAILIAQGLPLAAILAFTVTDIRLSTRGWFLIGLIGPMVGLAIARVVYARALAERTSFIKVGTSILVLVATFALMGLTWFLCIRGVGIHIH